MMYQLLAVGSNENDPKFAKEWMKENEEGRPNLTKWRKEADKDVVEKVGRDLREMMPWMKK